MAAPIVRVTSATPEYGPAPVALSVARTWKAKLPTTVGVPLI